MTRLLLLYAMSGAVALATHLAVMALFVEVFHAPKLVATTIGFVAAVPVHYVIQRCVVFRSKGDVRDEFKLYVLVTLATMGLNAGLFSLIYAFTRSHYLLTQVAVTMLVFIFNFFVNRYMTFAQRAKAGGVPSASSEEKRR